MPRADIKTGPSFTQQVNGFAKRFAGKLTGKVQFSPSRPFSALLTGGFFLKRSSPTLTRSALPLLCVLILPPRSTYAAPLSLLTNCQDHEVAMGDALLEGKDVQEARATAEAVKAQQP